MHPISKFLAAGGIVVLAGLYSGVSSAQEPNCEDPQTQAEMTGCAGLDWEAADAELNEVWEQALTTAKDQDGFAPDDGRPGYEETLRDAQRSWIQFRDLACQYAGYAARGGTMEPMLINQCLSRLTKTHTDELRLGIQEMGMQ